ncbi:MAG: hypothetical protein LBO69_03630 [Ignavibacteria bacterium]|jgi:hypothetical protein|nr:hypothetical protein [Ignavibacteria bacterium]
MKKQNTIIYILSIFVLSFGVTLAQGDNDYQHFYTRAQTVIGKSVENISKADVTTLNNIIATSVNAFGEDNAVLVDKIVKQAKIKKQEYADYMDSKKRMANTMDALDEEAALRDAAEQRGDSLYSENMDLKKVIADLQEKVVKFERQSKVLDKANKMLQKENLSSKELLQTSSDMVRQMLTLMPSLSIPASTMDSLPRTLKDSLETAQCSVALLLKSNFLITLQQLKANQAFMDSAASYFRQNNKHTVEVIGYQDNCNAIVEKLRRSGIECAQGYASDIENEMNEFLLTIENADGNGSSFADFILNNIAWIGPVCLVIFIGIILLVRKTSSNNVNRNIGSDKNKPE